MTFRRPLACINAIAENASDLGPTVEIRRERRRRKKKYAINGNAAYDKTFSSLLEAGFHGNDDETHDCFRRMQDFFV